MASTRTFDAFDANDGVTYKVLNAGQLDGPDRDLVLAEYAVRSGGRFVRLRDKVKVVEWQGVIMGATPAAVASGRDALVKAFARPQKRLISDEQDTRFYVASLASLKLGTLINRAMFYTATFVAIDPPFAQAAAPTADVRTPTLALLPNETTKYALQYTLTPGGTAPTPVRVLIVTKTGGPTTTVTAIKNITSGERLAYVGNLAALSLLVIDTWTGRATVSDMTSVVGYYPLHDASAGAVDFSGHNRPLSATGGITYQADGTLGPAMTFNGTTGYQDSADAAFGILTTLSVHARVKPSSIGVAGGIAGKASANAGYQLSINAAGNFVARVFASTLRTVTSATVAAAGSWYDLEFSYDAATGNLALEVNGTLEAYNDGAVNNPNAGTNNFRIGGAHNPSGGSAEFFAGTIEDVAVWTGVAHTQAQVNAMYGNGADVLGGVPEWNAVKSLVRGSWPLLLDPGLGTTNQIEIDSEHATTLPTPIVDIAWRSRYF